MSLYKLFHDLSWITQGQDSLVFSGISTLLGVVSKHHFPCKIVSLIFQSFLFIHLNRKQGERNSVGSNMWRQHKLFLFHHFLGIDFLCQTILQIWDLCVRTPRCFLLPWKHEEGLMVLLQQLLQEKKWIEKHTSNNGRMNYFTILAISQEGE